MSAVDWTPRELDRRITRIEDTKPDVQKQRIDEIVGDVGEIRYEVRSLRRALYTFAFSLLTASILFAVTVFASGFGHA